MTRVPGAGSRILVDPVNGTPTGSGVLLGLLISTGMAPSALREQERLLSTPLRNDQKRRVGAFNPSYFLFCVFASAGRAAARASPLPPPAKACWRFSGFESLPKIWPELATDRACNHASFAREPTHPTLTGGSGPRRRRLARSAHAIEAERGARRPRWRPPEAARDLRPQGVLRRRLVAGEVPRLQALPRVTALLTALLLAPRLVGLASTRSLHCTSP